MANIEGGKRGFEMPVWFLPIMALGLLFSVLTNWAVPQLRRLIPDRQRTPLLLFTDLPAIEAALAQNVTSEERRQLLRLRLAVRTAFAIWSGFIFCIVVVVPILIVRCAFRPS